jgi:hypothetical protein
MSAPYRPGECVVYRKPKFSTHPGPRATSVWATPHGDSYSYCVEKYYRVAEVGAGKAVVVVTRRGRRRVLAADDPALRRARWWERLWFRHRFPAPAPADEVVGTCGRGG